MAGKNAITPLPLYDPLMIWHHTLRINGDRREIATTTGINRFRVMIDRLSRMFAKEWEEKSLRQGVVAVVLKWRGIVVLSHKSESCEEGGRYNEEKALANLYAEEEVGGRGRIIVAGKGDGARIEVTF